MAPKITFIGGGSYQWTSKLLIDLVTNLRRSHNERGASLLELDALLRASHAVFKTQRERAGELEGALKARLETPGNVGLDRLFSSVYDQMLPEELDLHAVLRGMTEHAVRRLNTALSDWLRADRTFKLGYRRAKEWRNLGVKLSALEAHLLLWHAKYEVWIPPYPKHALVYLADEERHGPGFPGGLDELVAKLAAKWRGRGEEPQSNGTPSEPNRD